VAPVPITFTILTHSRVGKTMTIMGSLYAEYRGVVREIMAKLRKQLQVRQLETKPSQMLLVTLTKTLVYRNKKEHGVRHRLWELAKWPKQTCLLQKKGRHLLPTPSISLAFK